MTSKEFLKSRLFTLSAEYPAAAIKYYFDSFDNDHFICIFPNSELSNIIRNEALEIDRHFINKFPSESLSFIEIDNNLQFDELVFEYQPTSKLEVKTINISKLVKTSNSHYFEKSIYKEPLFLVRKIEHKEIIIDKEENEFAFAA